MSENIPHSLGGFRGAFESEHGRKPTEQEIWNAAIRSWRDITRQKSDSAKELTLEQITRIYDRYGGDMVNCTRAIERELAAARSQPVREPELEHVNCDDCTYHYKEADQKPCNTCIHSGDFGSNFEPRHGITKKGEAKEQTP